MRRLPIVAILLCCIGFGLACCTHSPSSEEEEADVPFTFDNDTQKMVIYQVFTRLFGADSKENTVWGTPLQNGCGKFADFTLRALDSIKGLGATHIWYTGVIEHATQTDHTADGIPLDHPAVIKGKAGSAYAIKDYYDVDPDLATHPAERMKEFENLVRRTHRAGLGVLIDFVPNHVARQYHSDAKPEGVEDLGEGDDPTKPFSVANNFYYIPDSVFSPRFDLNDSVLGPYHEQPAKATGNDQFHPSPSRDDWYETVKLNYGVDYLDGRKTYFDPIPDTWLKMRDILLFWAGKGIDGFRCDMAEMVPVEFWHWAIASVKGQYPDLLFIAEIYGPHAYRSYIHHGGFDYLYDKVGLYDTLRTVVNGNSALAITSCWQAVDDIASHMVNFLENHDEQRIASPFFAGDARKGRAPLLVSALLRTNPMMIYFGQELGEAAPGAQGFSGDDGRTTIFDYWTLPTIRRWRNAGKYDGGQLTDEEKDLRSYYSRVLTIARDEPAVGQGLFFDLMYANTENPMMNPHRQYAFLRKWEDTLLLVVANFDAQPTQSQIRIPAHAFDYLQLPTDKSDYQAVDLLTDEQVDVTLTPDGLTQVQVPGLSGVVLKIDLSE